MRDDEVRIVIGKCVLIGRRSFINTAGRLEIGSHTLLGPNVYISDVDHDYSSIHLPVAMGGITAGRSVTVEENCWLGMNSVISGSLTVGRGSIIGANAVVTKDVAPFCVVVGNPGRVMHDAARAACEDPDRLSFIHTVRVLRRRLPQAAAVSFSPSGTYEMVSVGDRGGS